LFESEVGGAPDACADVVEAVGWVWGGGAEWEVACGVGEEFLLLD